MMTNANETDATTALEILSGFISGEQLAALRYGLRGEEKQFFFDKAMEMSQRIASMPKTYEQEGRGDQAIVYLHYFRGNMDWYIIEKDEGTAEEPGQHQAFGLADFGDGGELGYISIHCCPDVELPDRDNWLIGNK
jgi:hypothetical protein